jgi:hypothetical protein
MTAWSQIVLIPASIHMPAWGEIAIAAGIAAIVVFWFHGKNRFETIGAPIVFGAIIMLFVLLFTGGPISFTIEYGVKEYVGPVLRGVFGLLVMIGIVALVGGWVIEKFRKLRK